MRTTEMYPANKPARGRGGEGPLPLWLAALLITALSFIFLPGAMAGQEAAGEETATLTGKVLRPESNEPLEGVEIRIAGTSRGDVTGAAGRFTIEGISPGEITLLIRQLEGPEGQLRLRLQPRETRTVILDVYGQVRDLGDLRVEVRDAEAPRRGKLAGFDRRRAQGFGEFFDREDIERTQSDYISDVLRQTSGLRVESVSGNFTGDHARVVSTRGFSCSPSFWLDGMRLLPEDLSHALHAIPKEDLEAIEVYSGPARTPVQFRTPGNSCGAVLFWTRTS